MTLEELADWVERQMHDFPPGAHVHVRVSSSTLVVQDDLVDEPAAISIELC